MILASFFRVFVLPLSRSVYFSPVGLGKITMPWLPDNELPSESHKQVNACERLARLKLWPHNTRQRRASKCGYEINYSPTMSSIRQCISYGPYVKTYRGLRYSPAGSEHRLPFPT